MPEKIPLASTGERGGGLTVPLRPSEEGPGQDEGPLHAPGPLDEALGGGCLLHGRREDRKGPSYRETHSVDIVNVPND